MAPERIRADIAEGSVFALTPEMRGETGWECAQWSKNVKLLFRGRVRVVSVASESLSVVLVTPEGSIYATLPVANAESFEKVADSSRYFVLRAVAGDRVAYLGIGFNDRDNAYKCTSAVYGYFDELSAISESAGIQARSFQQKGPVDLDLKIQPIVRPARRPVAIQLQNVIDDTIPADWVTF